ncbi:MAG: DUF7507 domain-containing protein [Acidimicrobiales bacterium]
MFGPLAHAVAGRASRHPLGVAGIVAGTLMTTFALTSMLRPADAVSLSAEEDLVPIVSVALIADDSFVALTQPSTEVVDHGHDPVELAAITVDDDGERIRLVPRPGTVDVISVGFPSNLDDVAASENGAQTESGTAGFEVATERVFGSSDLRDYLRSDDPENDGSDWDHDLDLVFDQALIGGQYLVVRERGGDASLRLTALDEAGLPFATGRTVVIGPDYDWNTGFAPGDANPAQPVHLAVFRAESMLATTAADGEQQSTTISGFRIETNQGADLNLAVFVDESSDAARPSVPVEEALASANPASSPAVAALGQVYSGHDGGVACATAESFVEANQGDPLTYCLTVTNTGDLPLTDLVVAAPSLSSEFSIVSGVATPLAPGDSVSYSAAATPPPDDADGELDETYVASVTVTGAVAGSTDPVVASTEIVAFPPGEDEAIAPNVSLRVGTQTDDVSCGGGDTPASGERAANRPGGDERLTYCFTVTNTGNTHLDSIAVSDPTLPGTPTMVDADSEPLAPGGAAVFALEAPAQGSVSPDPAAPPLVTANAVDSTGSDLVGVEDVQATEPNASPAPTPTPTPGPAQAAVESQTAVPPAGESPPADSAGVGSSAPSSSATAGALLEPSARALSETSGSAAVEEPTELAFTGWESSVFALLGLTLVLVGLALLYPDCARRVGAFTLGQVGDPVRDYFEY